LKLYRRPPKSGRVGGTGGVEKQKRKAFKIYPSPQKICFEDLGKLGPPKPKAKEERFRLSGKNKGRQSIKSRTRLRRRRDAVIALAMSAGDLKENKKPFFEAARKKRFVIFWCLPAYHNIFCLTS